MKEKNGTEIRQTISYDHTEINGNNRIDPEDVIYVLRHIADE